jgi:hypothetical protein
MHFVSIYENRRIKNVEIVLRRGEGGIGRTMKEVNIVSIYVNMHNYYMLIKFFSKPWISKIKT